MGLGSRRNSRQSVQKKGACVAFTLLMGIVLFSQLIACKANSKHNSGTKEVTQNRQPNPLPPPPNIPQKTPKELLVEEIQKYCSSIDGHGVKRPPDAIVAMAVAGDPPAVGWQRFQSEDELQNMWKKDGTDDAAYIWFTEGKILFTAYTLQSNSGDWAVYARYCFRGDGAIASIESELRTFEGNISAQRKWFFDSNGEIVQFSETFADLTTDKPTQPGEGFYNQETPIYKKVTELPYYI